jgi:hypothetical protein
VKDRQPQIKNQKSKIKNLNNAGDPYATATSSTKEKKEG